MAESTAKIADVAPEVEKVEAVPSVAPEAAPASPPKSEELTTEKPAVDEPATEAEKPSAPEAAEASQETVVEAPAPAVETSAPPAECSVPATEESKDVKVEAVEIPVDIKEDVAPAVEMKATDAPAPTKSDHPSLFQKFKKTFEFPKISKNKESPSKEAPSKEAPKEAPKEEVAETAEPSPAVQASPASETTPPAATTESKPSTGEKLQEKVSEGKNFFNKLVKKSFFTKSHSFSGAIPETKQGTTPAAAAPSAIVEAAKEAESVPVSTPPETETTAPAVAEPVAETTTPPAVAEATPAAEAPAVVADEATPATEETQVAPSEGVEEKAVVKEDKPKNKFFQKIVRRLLPKNSAHSTLQPAAPAAAPVVAASA